jgi:predicted PurR-regulated permease PerM
VLTVFARFKVKIRKWFGAQMALSLIVGAVVMLGMLLLKVRYPFILALTAAVLEVVPIIGPVIAGSMAFLVAVSDSLSLGVYVVLFFVAVQQIENHLLVPIIMGKTMKVHPVIVIISLLAGGEAAGFVGIVLAVPIAVMAQEIYNYLEERKNERIKADEDGEAEWKTKEKGWGTGG